MVKYALIIGISYKGTKKQLPGCLNDVVTIYNLLKSWGFTQDKMMILADGEISRTNFDYNSSIGNPTSFNVNNALSVFTRQLKIGDKGFIYYSGHGSRVNTKNNRLESSIVPVDFKKSGMVTSETIRYHLNKIPSGVNLFCMFDCCNSGTVCDLKYHIYDTSYKKDIEVKMKRFDYTEWNRRQHNNVLREYKVSDSLSIDTQANIISLSGCWDTQVSYDLGRNGALTLAFMKAISNFKISEIEIKHLLQDVRGMLLQMRISQTPQIMCGNKFEMECKLSEFLNI